MTRRISSKPTLREETGDSINWGWTKTSKVSVRPGTVASGGHSSATMLEATGLTSSMSMELIAAAILRSVVSILTWICKNLRNPGEVTRSPDC